MMMVREAGRKIKSFFPPQPAEFEILWWEVLSCRDSSSHLAGGIDHEMDPWRC